MSGHEQPPDSRPPTAPGRIVFVAGLVSLLLVLGGSLATVGLSAAGFADPSSGACSPSDASGVGWTRYTWLLALAGVALSIIALVFGRHIAFVLRLPAMVAAACALPVIIVSAMFATIAYGGEC